MIYDRELPGQQAPGVPYVCDGRSGYKGKSEEGGKFHMPVEESLLKKICSKKICNQLLIGLFQEEMI